MVSYSVRVTSGLIVYMINMFDLGGGIEGHACYADIYIRRPDMYRTSKVIPTYSY